MIKKNPHFVYKMSLRLSARLGERLDGSLGERLGDKLDEILCEWLGERLSERLDQSLGDRLDERVVKDSQEQSGWSILVRVTQL